MKNKIILALVTIIFISSCANKFSLTKRKYTKGYYFASSKNNNSASKANTHKQATVKNLPAKHIEIPTEKETIPEIKNTTGVEFAKIETTSKKNNPHKNTTTQLTASAGNKNIATASKVIFKAVSEKQPFVKYHKKGDDGVKLVVLVILCLFPFINLIAIFVHDNNSITLNFWITLLLDFLLIVGVIFALLVVLDVVDLK